MGKMLIIKGAIYTPSSSSGSNTPVSPDPVVTDPVNPDPPASDYSFYFLSTDGKWYSDRSAAGTIKSVSLVIADAWESDITAISSSFTGSDIPGRRLLLCSTAPFSGGASFTDSQSLYSTGDQLPASYDVGTGVRFIHIWLDDGGSAPLSSSRIDSIMDLARQCITFTHG